MSSARDRARAGARDEGSASIELVVLGPAFLLLVMLLVMGGRMAMAQQAVTAAAGEAARTATLTRGEPEAVERGTAAATTFLAEQDLACTGAPTVAIDAAALRSDPGVPGEVQATVTCTVGLAGLELPGVGDITVTGEASSPLDTYRER